MWRVRFPPQKKPQWISAFLWTGWQISRFLSRNQHVFLMNYRTKYYKTKSTYEAIFKQRRCIFTLIIWHENDTSTFSSSSSLIGSFNIWRYCINHSAVEINGGTDKSLISAPCRQRFGDNGWNFRRKPKTNEMLHLQSFSFVFKHYTLNIILFKLNY